MVWFDTPPPPRATPQLSRDRVVGAAVELADRQPAGEITMRALATELGVRSPMALYRYVGSKDGLADLMADQVYGEMRVPRGDGWRPALAGLGRRWARTRSASTTPPWPSWSRSAWTRPPGWASSRPCSARSSGPGWPCWRSGPCGPGPAWPPRPTWTAPSGLTSSASPPPGRTRTFPPGPRTRAVRRPRSPVSSRPWTGCWTVWPGRSIPGEQVQALLAQFGHGSDPAQLHGT